MKKITLAILSAAILSICVYAASDRLDLYRADQSFVSVLVNEISEISYLPNESNDGYDKLNIQRNDGKNIQFDMTQVSHIKYSTPTQDFLEITRTGDDHSRIVMLDCINNDGIMDSSKSNDWTAERADGIPHFITDVDLGFDAIHIVTGKYTGNVYTDYPGYVYLLESEDENNLFGQDCWAFVMPNEPVEIKSVSTERTTYVGMDFIGTYKGYPVAVGENRLIKGDKTQFEITFNGNETYQINTTDSHEFSFVDLYTYDQNNNTFQFQYIEPERLDYQAEDTYGAIGQFFGTNDILVDIHNVTVDKSENIKRYFGSKTDVEYICAAREDYGYQYLIEITEPQNGNLTKWYFLDNYGYIKKEASVEFISGTTIGEACEAKVSFDGDLQLKYILEDGKAPLFIAKGNEAGTYTSSDEANPEITLDGFGEIRYGDETYSYTLESGILTVVIDGTTRLFILNFDNNTYTETQSDEWDGAITYINETVLGAYFTDGETNTQNRVTITIDHNLVGTEKPGYASISVDLFRNPGHSNGVADCQRYIYMKNSGTLILTNVLTGSSSGETVRRNLVFSVSEDKTRLYMAGEGEDAKIYATSGGYVITDINNSLVGELQSSAVANLAAKYTGKATFDMFGSAGDADISLAIDTDKDGAAKAGYATFIASAMGTDMIAACVEYALEGNTLTLKGVTVGDGNYGTTTTDIVFTVNDNATLTGSGVYYGDNMNTALMKLILTDVVLSPESQEQEPAKIELAAKYSGTAQFNMFGSAGEANITLSIDTDKDGAAKAGYATFIASAMGTDMIAACVEYTLEGNTLTLKGVTVGDGNYGTTTADIIFTANEDDSLTGNGEYYGDNMNTAMMKLILTDATLLPTM